MKDKSKNCTEQGKSTDLTVWAHIPGSSRAKIVCKIESPTEQKYPVRVAKIHDGLHLKVEVDFEHTATGDSANCIPCRQNKNSFLMRNLRTPQVVQCLS